MCSKFTSCGTTSSGITSPFSPSASLYTSASAVSSVPPPLNQSPSAKTNGLKWLLNLPFLLLFSSSSRSIFWVSGFGLNYIGGTSSWWGKKSDLISSIHDSELVSILGIDYFMLFYMATCAARFSNSNSYLAKWSSWFPSCGK